MGDDYLWDRAGDPDPEVERLERLLGRFRGKEAPSNLVLPVEQPQEQDRTSTRDGGLRRWLLLGTAAAAALAFVALWLALQERPAYAIVSLEGLPQVGDQLLRGSGLFVEGQWLVTDDRSRAKIYIGALGEVNVEPRSRIRLLKAGDRQHRLHLQVGTIHVAIWAPPRLFIVDTPYAVAVDYGCVYSLSVDDSGAGVLHVHSGWVAFEMEKRESFVPANAVCETRPGIGPGTPYYADSTEAFQEAIRRLDFGSPDVAERRSALDDLLRESRPTDALTLWHLLLRPDEPGRNLIFDRMADLVPPPAGVTREGILQSDRKMLDLWWDQLGLGDTKWWELWKWPGPPQGVR